MTTLMVKDLEISKELTRKELSGVRGGVAAAGAGGQGVLTAGPSIFSPVIALNLPIANAINVEPKLDFHVNLDVANVVGSAFTGIKQ